MAEHIGAGLREKRAEKETRCVNLELSDGCHVYLKSSWETINLSIVVLDGVHAWSRTVSAKEVVSIATSWKVDVGEFMKSARSHLCRQHPTSIYSITAEKDADIVQLSFTINDLLEGDEGKETLQLNLRLTRLSDVGAVVRDMLDHLLEPKYKLKEQLVEAEHQLQTTLAASEPEPSITLSLARPRRQSSSFVEPRLLEDYTKPARSVCTPKVSTRLPSFDFQDHLTVRAREACVGFDTPLPPSIMRLLNNLSASGAKQWHGHGGLHGRRDEGKVATGGVCEERGVKITEMRSPGTNSVSIDVLKSTVPEGQPRLNLDMGAGITRPGKYNGLEEDIAFQQNDTVNRSAFSEKEKLPENHVNGGVLGKGSSNAGESVRGLNKFAEGEPKDQEPTSKVTAEDVHLSRSNSDPGSRVKAGFSEIWQHQQKLADQEEAHGAVRHEFRAETQKHSAEKRSLECLWSKDIFDTTGIASRSDKRSPVMDAPPGFERSTRADLLRKIPVGGGEGRGRGRGRGTGRGRGRTPLSARTSPRERKQRCEGFRGDRSPSEEGHLLDPKEINVDNFAVPDPDYYNFDKKRTEEDILPNQIWAVYDGKGGLPRVWAVIDKVSSYPKFEVSITWLTPHNPSVEAVDWFKTSGHLISCGKFKRGGKHVLSSINTFSHRMECEWVARNVVTIYPKKFEVWALYSSRIPDGGAKWSCFRVVHVLEDVEPEKGPFFSVLGRVKGFRTVYRPEYQSGAIPFKYLVRFSHRVPAHQLQGNEGPRAANLKGFWDVDPAALPLVHEPALTLPMSLPAFSRL